MEDLHRLLIHRYDRLQLRDIIPFRIADFESRLKRLREIDGHQHLVRLLHRRPGARGADGENPGRRGIAHPAQAVVETRGFADFQRRLRLPQENHVVVRLVAGRHLDQVEFPKVEPLHRLHPHARPVVVEGLRILIGIERAVALQEGPRARFLHRENAVAEMSRSRFQGPVVEISAAQLHQQAVAVMHLRPEIIRLRMGALAEPEHAGKRREPELLDRTAQRDFRHHVHDGFRSRSDRELIGARHAFAGEERAGLERFRAVRRFFQVEFREIRELLAHARQSAVDRQAARGKPVRRVLRNRPEITRAHENQELVHVSLRVQMRPRAPTRVARGRRRPGGDFLFPVVEQALVELQWPGLAARHLVECHHLLRRPSRVEEVDGERPLFLRPQSGIHLETDVAVLVVIQVFPEIRQFQLRRGIRRNRHFAGLGAQRIEREIFGAKGICR